MYASVILDAALDKELDYFLDEKWQTQARAGMRVLVPVRGHPRKGTIVSLKTSCSYAKVSPIQELLPDLSIPEDLLSLALWISHYYCTPLYKVFSLIFPSSVRGKAQPKTQLFIQSEMGRPALAELCQKLQLKNSSQAKILEVVLQYPKGILLSLLLEKSGVTRGPVDTLIKKQVLSSIEMRLDRSPLSDHEYFLTKHKTLSDEQQKAFDAIQATLQEKRFAPHLLFGVTGSGKTEIYLQAIQTALDLGRGAIFLVPEVALTSQMIERLQTRFTDKLAVLHYRLSHGERHDMWHQIRKKEARIVIGARSAIFSPVPDLGLIIVDEEHDSSYKSDEMPCYSARDAAVMRGKLSKATVILGSATPSFESYTNALNGKYQLSILKKRPASAKLPTIKIIDMQKEFEKKKGFALFSDALLSAIQSRSALGEQSLVFLNRRGYHTAQMCLSCTHVLECPHCSLSLTFHLGENHLACHLCDYRLSPPPTTCPKCKAETFKYKGAGTEMVERALHAILPDVKTLRLDADTTRHKGSHEIIFKQFRSGKADVLIGTQMIAKGFHFPSATLVGILNADSALNIPDFRSAETVFQLIVQVAGRAGRGALPGEVIIQTHLPEHPAIVMASEQDFEGFYAEEIETRKFFSYPPFSHLAKLIFSSTDKNLAFQEASRLRTFLIENLPSSFHLFPVIACGREKIKDRWRCQFLVKGNAIRPFSDSIAKRPKVNPNVSLLIDVDPLSTFF